MKIYACSYIEISELSKGIADDAWDNLMDTIGSSSETLTWGNMNHALVDAPRIIKTFDNYGGAYVSDVVTLVLRLKRVPKGVLVDLGN